MRTQPENSARQDDEPVAEGQKRRVTGMYRRVLLRHERHQRSWPDRDRDDAAQEDVHEAADD